MLPCNVAKQKAKSAASLRSEDRQKFTFLIALEKFQLCPEEFVLVSAYLNTMTLNIEEHTCCTPQIKHVSLV